MGIVGAVMVPHPPLIIPEIGRGQEQKIQKTIRAYHQAAEWIGTLQPETVILLSPHQIMYADYFHISPGGRAEGDFVRFGAGHVKMAVNYDTEFVNELCRRADAQQIPAGTYGERDCRLDHGTMVPLYFVNQYWTNYRLVRIGLSGLPFSVHRQLGQCIRHTVDALGRKAVLIASGDLSHRLKADGPYGYQKEGPAYDAKVMDVMGSGQFQKLMDFSEEFCSRAGECGHRGFIMMAGALGGDAVSAQRLSYEGPFGVGYGVCMYGIDMINRKELCHEPE